MNFFDSAKLALAAYKDALSEESHRLITQSYFETLQAEADARRAMVANDIMNMSRLRIAVKKLEYNYTKIIGQTGPIPVLEEMIRTAQTEIARISLHKNHRR